MSVRLYIESDLTQVNRWEAMCDMPLSPKHGLPKIGFIVPGVCAGFLYQTDSSICFLDGFIANPEVRGPERQRALNGITDALIISAQDLGYKSVMAFTKNQNIKARCECYGFNPRGEYNLFVRGF